MKRKEVQELRHGLYRIWWITGDKSLAAVGSFDNGDRWIASTNWVKPISQFDMCSVWDKVERVELMVASQNQSVELDAKICNLVLYQCANHEVLDYFDGKGDCDIAKKSYMLIVTRLKELLESQF